MHVFRNIALLGCTAVLLTIGLTAHAQPSYIVNEMGRIPVLEYHNIASVESRWTRSRENFKKDLEFLYNNDYSLITVKELVSGRIPVPAGKKPVVMTFDDGSIGQFSFDETGKPDPNSAIGMLENFCAEHRDFRCSAIFYVNGDAFKEKDAMNQKLKYLLDHGYEIGNHTMEHVDLHEVKNLEYQMGALNNRLLDAVQRDLVIDSIAYPFGHYPEGDDFELMKNGSYEGRRYHIASGFLVGAQPSYSPYDDRFDPYKIYRIQAIDDEWKRHFNRVGTATDRVEENFDPFVSDGIAEKNSSGENHPITFDGQIDEPFILEFNPIILATPQPKLEPVAVIEVSEDSVLPSTSSDSSSHSESPSQLAQLVTPVIEVYDSAYDAVIPLLNAIEIQDLPQTLEYDGEHYWYSAQEGDSYESIARQFQNYSYEFMLSDFIKQLKEANNSQNFGVGDRLIIPGVVAFKVNEAQNIQHYRGVYLTGYSVKASGREFVQKVKDAGGTMIVFDVKAGVVQYDTQNEQVIEMNDKTRNPYNLKVWMDYLHKNGIYGVARFVLFKDAGVASKNPDWNLKDSVTGRPWANNEGAIWLDPSNPDVQHYIIGLVKEMEAAGVDEVQFDYVRFPALGPVARMSYRAAAEGKERHEVITDFLRTVKTALGDTDMKLSADVFGVAAWSDLDARMIGQKIPDLAGVLDVIYPMVYPSHFGAGYHGHKNPADEPYYFVNESMKKFIELAGDSDLEIRPWFQGFPLGVSSFGAWYMEAQKKAVNDLNMDSFVIWSPGNIYTYSWGVLREMGQ